ncbi:MAG: ATP synthase F0 subunit B [Candidatus Aminicenantes bacterium]|nr:ATP synthase F0 subunit B [Candidatus Aminicenantes bacterium]
MLELNSSFIWIFFLVWILYLSLNRIFFRPIGRVIHEREAKINADSERQRLLLSQIEERTQTVENRLGEARREALRIREELLRRGDDLRSRAVAEARKKAARLLQEQMAQLESEIVAAERTLQKQVADFSETIKKAYL